MQNLQSMADELKQEQLNLRQSINEKNTASILVGMFAREQQKSASEEDPRIEGLLQRPADDIPDSTKIPELPALILPGQHNSKRNKKKSESGTSCKLPDDGIDYDLLGKDRALCSPSELDKIRRERNRMHAKRTRDRKRIFMEEMEELIKQLEEENELLRAHLSGLEGPGTTNPLVSPDIQPAKPNDASIPSDNLLSSVSATAVSTSSDVSGASSCEDSLSGSDGPASKRRRVEKPIPSSITTQTAAATTTEN